MSAGALGTSALIVVDVQNDYVLEGGALPCPDAATLIPVLNAAMNRSWTGGIYLTLDLKAPGDEKDSHWPAHCVEGTDGQQLAVGLELPSSYIAISKRRSMSAFGDERHGEVTQLETLLQHRETTHVVIVGLALEYCVCATAEGAALKGFKTAVILEGCRPFEPLSDRTLETTSRLVRAGVKVYSTFDEYFSLGSAVPVGMTVSN